MVHNKRRYCVRCGKPSFGSTCRECYSNNKYGQLSRRKSWKRQSKEPEKEWWEINPVTKEEEE